MNAQPRLPIQRAAPSARRLRRVADEIVRMARRPTGVGIDEVCDLTGMKEQTARSRLSKLRAKGFDIFRNPKDNRYYLVPPPRSKGQPVEEPVEEDEDGNPDEETTPSPAARPVFDAPAVTSALPDRRALLRVLEIMATQRELHLVNFQGRLIFSHFNEHGVYQMEHVDLDLSRTLEALRHG